MAFKILGSHLSDHTRSLAEDPSVSGRPPHARSAPARARVARGLIADGEVGGVEAAMRLELGVEAALEDAADQKMSAEIKSRSASSSLPRPLRTRARRALA